MLMRLLMVMARTVIVMFSWYQTGSQQKLKRGCWIQLALFMRCTIGSGSLRIKSGELGLAYVGGDTGYRVAGVGDIKIKMFDGVEWMLRGVRHVPGLRRNLISLGVLHDGGMVFPVIGIRRP